ncbi:MAG: hypothetical protein WDM90_07440 [Ferruginibacter sp.]
MPETNPLNDTVCEYWLVALIGLVEPAGCFIVIHCPSPSARLPARLDEVTPQP